MTPTRNMALCTQAKRAVEILARHYRHGAYRAIRDPDGVVGLWAIEGNPGDLFSISFVDKGRVYHNIDDVPDYVLKSFVEYVRKSVR